MQHNVIEISSYPRYNPIVSGMVLTIYNSWNPKYNKDLDDWQKYEYRNALELLRIANDKA